MKLKRLVEQHFHGAFGIDFNTATSDEIRFLSKEIYKRGVGYIFPTLVTDTVENINRQMRAIEKAANNNSSDEAKIVGVHLEGIFLNPEKKGIHDSSLFLKPTVENYKKVEHPLIKILTLAPELCPKDNSLINYLHTKGVKVQAGHCVGADLAGCDGVTHTFNAMSGVSHKTNSTALSALIDDNLYTEVIADGIHVCDDALKLMIKSKPVNKILLISDCLHCTESNLKEFNFAGSKIYYDGQRATSKDATLAGSVKLLPDIIRLLIEKGLFKPQFIENSYTYHNLPDIGEFNI